MRALEWGARAEPLAPAGLVASGTTVAPLLDLLAGRPDAQGLRLAGTRSLLVLLGEAARLPWLDGVRYCAPDPDAPGLWLPTQLQPSWPSDLLHAALRRRTGQSSMLLWPEPEVVLPLDEAAPLDAALLAWMRAEFA
jgi:hypothetical protein